MTTTAWAHLPNAAHIDRVFASVKANPDHWAAAWDVVQDTTWAEVRNVLKDQGRSAVWEEVREAAQNAAWDASGREKPVWYSMRDVSLGASWNATYDTIFALVAYDDCAYMLDSDPSELAILAAFSDPRAVLLLSACKAFHSIKELV